MQVFTEKIDKHLLIKVGCKKRIAHDKKELRKVMIELLDEYLETLWLGSPVDEYTSQYQNHPVAAQPSKAPSE